MKLSIIIPVFNTAQYIDQCIYSIYDSNMINLDEFEVIVVNDGSTDDSRKKVEKLQKEFQNLILINKENEGVSRARNVGLDNAKGDFIFFVDSDDFLLKNALIFLLDRIKQVTKNLYKFKTCRCSKGIISEKSTRRELFSPELWNFIFNKKLINKLKLRFIDVKYGEDFNFVAKFIALCDSYEFIDENIYVYREDNVNSAMNVVSYDLLLYDNFKFADNLIDFYMENRTIINYSIVKDIFFRIFRSFISYKVRSSINDSVFFQDYKRIYFKSANISILYRCHPFTIKFYEIYYRLRFFRN
ncbi:glycosyltransferase family 2 protein [Capnocytophaga canis]|uniref:glycosyltransferase family 2 protein n=1 Tax=Capnocytophaga canis TaxID=1848903 RepID=UPI001561EBEA|nr:glycosyltransferase [Capnocytophaga canis]